MMLIYKIIPDLEFITITVIFILAMVTALGFGLWLSALNVRFRDINHLVPFIIEIWKYVTPVIYGSTLIPEKYRFILGLNPMTGVVEGFRWAILGGKYVETFQSRPIICRYRS